MSSAARRAFGGVFRFAKDISLPLVFIAVLALWPIANYKVGGGLLLPHGAVFLGLRVIVVVAAGFLATYGGRRRLWTAAAAGALAFFVEQALINSVFFVISGQYQSAINAITVFRWFFWIPALIGLCGGLIGQAFSSQRADS